MNDGTKIRSRGPLPQEFLPPVSAVDGNALLARYGAELEDGDMSEEQKREFLLALFRIMQAFVDLGFSGAPGGKTDTDDALGLHNVLEYLLPEETAHETVAPAFTPETKEQR